MVSRTVTNAAEAAATEATAAIMFQTMTRREV